MLNSSKTKEKARFAFFTSFRLNKIEILDVLLNSYVIIDISVYRLTYINIKDIIVFKTLKIKDIYNLYYISIFFKEEN